MRHTVLLLLFFVCSITGISAQEKIPDDELLKNANGEELQRIIDSYEGEKAVLVNVWATWCAPCIEEFPHIVKLQRKYPDRLQVVFVSGDFADARERALEFLRKQEVDWTTYFKDDKDQAFIEALSTEWSGALPFTKIVSSNGEVVASWEDKTDFSTFEKHVKQAMNQ